MTTQMPKILLNAIPGPDDITRQELANGIVVLARPNFNSASVVISGYVQAGSIFDSDAKLGLADFTASALMRGTSRRTFNQLYNQLEEVGAGLGFSGGTHTVGVHGRSLAEDLPMLLDILVDTLRQPAFPPKHVEKLRAALLTGLDFRQQDPKDRAELAFDELVYPDHPYGRPDEGHPHTVRAIRRADLKAFHGRHYGPRGMVLAVVGGIEPQQAIDLITGALRDWRVPAQTTPPELPAWRPLTEAKRIRVDIPEKSQSSLVVGTAGPPRSAPEYMAAYIGNQILGEFGLMGRIGESLRERSGLAYYAYSGLGSSLGPSAWTVSAGVNPKDEQRAVGLILDEVRRFVSEPVSNEELGDVQANLIGSMPLSLESNAGVASRLLHMERYQLGMDYLRCYPALVQAINRENVLEAAARYLDPDKLAIAIAGPPEAGGDHA